MKELRRGNEENRMKEQMENEDIGYLFKRIHDRLKMSADAVFEKNNLTSSQARLMEFVDVKGGRVTQKSIEEYLNVSHPTVVGIVSRLERSGFLECHTDPEDKRNKIVCMTQRACSVGDELAKGRIMTEQKLLQHMSQQEIAELRRLLNRVYSNLQE